MEIITQILILFASLAFLIKFAQLVVRYSVKLTRVTRLSEMTLGFILLSVATSLPELAVSFSAVTSNEIGIAVGSLLGSNVVNMTLVLGISSILVPFSTEKTELSGLLSALFLSAFVSLLVLLSEQIKTAVGLVLLLIFSYFCYYSARKGITMEKIKTAREVNILPQVIILCLGLLGVIVSARFVVDTAASLAKSLHVAETIIGATLIAVGTSLPEFSITLLSMKRGHAGLALGNIVGSCVTNLTLILGTLILISPIQINLTAFSSLAAFVLISNLLLWHFIEDGKIDLREGIVLFLLFLIFMLTELGVQVSMFV